MALEVSCNVTPRLTVFVASCEDPTKGHVASFDQFVMLVVEARPPEVARDGALTESAFAVSPGEAGSPGSRAGGTTRTAAVAAVAESVAEAWPLEIANRASEAGSSWPGADDTTSADVAAVAGPAGEARPLGIAKHGTTTESDIAVSSGGAGPDWSRAEGMNSAAATAAVKAVGEARPPRFVKYSVTSESEPELAESPCGETLLPIKMSSSRSCSFAAWGRSVRSECSRSCVV